MESLRALVGMKPKDTASDETVFVEELGELLKPHVLEVLKKDFNMVEGEDNTVIFMARLHERLLKRFFAFAKTDPGLGKFMFPIMMYLRKARADRQKITPAP